MTCPAGPGICPPERARSRVDPEWLPASLDSEIASSTGTSRLDAILRRGASVSGIAVTSADVLSGSNGQILQFRLEQPEQGCHRGAMDGSVGRSRFTDAPVCADRERPGAQGCCAGTGQDAAEITTLRRQPQLGASTESPSAVAAAIIRWS